MGINFDSEPVKSNSNQFMKIFYTYFTNSYAFFLCVSRGLSKEKLTEFSLNIKDLLRILCVLSCQVFKIFTKPIFR